MTSPAVQAAHPATDQQRPSRVKLLDLQRRASSKRRTGRAPRGIRQRCRAAGSTAGRRTLELAPPRVWFAFTSLPLRRSLQPTASRRNRGRSRLPWIFVSSVCSAFLQCLPCFHRVSSVASVSPCVFRVSSVASVSPRVSSVCLPWPLSVAALSGLTRQ